MDRRIDERLRKPRRTKGTPFYIERNYWAAGVILFGAISWILLEVTPSFKKLKKYQIEHLNEDSEALQTRIKHYQLGAASPAINELLTKARERAAYKDEPKPQGWIAKMLASRPEL